MAMTQPKAEGDGLCPLQSLSDAVAEAQLHFAGLQAELREKDEVHSVCMAAAQETQRRLEARLKNKDSEHFDLRQQLQQQSDALAASIQLSEDLSWQLQQKSDELIQHAAAAEDLQTKLERKMGKPDEGLVACQAACNKKEDEVNQLLARNECLVAELAATELRRKDLELRLAKSQPKELGGSAPHVDTDQSDSWPELVGTLVKDSKEKLYPGNFVYAWSQKWPEKNIDEYKPVKKISDAINKYVNNVALDADGYYFFVGEARLRQHQPAHSSPRRDTAETREGARPARSGAAVVKSRNCPQPSKTGRSPSAPRSRTRRPLPRPKRSASSLSWPKPTRAPCVQWVRSPAINRNA